MDRVDAIGMMEGEHPGSRHPLLSVGAAFGNRDFLL
jgi:hypothetical protein